MSNPATYSGFRLVKKNDKSYSVNAYIIPASDGTKTYVGDVVKSSGSADAATGLATVIAAAAGDTMRGVVVGIEPVDSAASLQLEVGYRLASTRTKVYVCDDPNAEFEVTAYHTGATTAHTLGVNDIGENCDLEVLTANDAYGRSGMALDATTHTSSSAQFRVLRFVNREDNDNSSNEARVVVKPNEHELSSTSGV